MRRLTEMGRWAAGATSSRAFPRESAGFPPDLFNVYGIWSLQGRRKLTSLFCISSWLAPYIPDHADIGSYSQSTQLEATTTSHISRSSSNNSWHKRQPQQQQLTQTPSEHKPPLDADALSHAPALAAPLLRRRWQLRTAAGTHRRRCPMLSWTETSPPLTSLPPCDS